MWFKDTYCFKHALFWVIALCALRIYYLSPLSYTYPILLSFDEAQYWLWSKTPDLGYFSKPPMIAWVINLFTQTCGDGLACVKSVAVLFNGATALVLYALAKQMFADKKVAFWVALSFILLPGISFSSIITSTDVLLMFFWALSLLFFYLAIQESSQDYWWLWLGFVCGLGVMSKYTMIAFGGSAFLFMLFHREHRQEFKNPRLWVAFLTTFLIFSPNLYWNALHDFISLSHTNDNVISKEVAVYPAKLAEFFGAQFIVFSPLFFGLLLWLLSSKHASIFAKDSTRLLWFTTVPLLLAGLIVSFIASAQAHWAAPAYIAGTLLVVHHCHTHNRWWVVKLSLVLHIVFFITLHHTQWVVANTSLTKSPFDRINRWNAIAITASETLHQNPNALLVVDDRKAVGPLAYQLRSSDGTPYPVQKWNADGQINDQFDMIGDLNYFAGYDMIMITRRKNDDRLKPYFEASTLVKSETLYGAHYNTYLLKNFKGY